MPIRILDAATVGRIAAGEVVERPSSVVKELVENSIDAGATAITVEIRGGGIDYMRVTDNGCGIEPGQVRLAFENHATSKLQSAEQLDDIRTLGFRGEALPSIASVSHVEMTTRAREQDTGVRLTIDGGENTAVREVGCPEGTTIIMRDLFYNVPVRRAFLKKPGYEGGLVSDVVARMIMGNPKVSIRLLSNGATTLHSFGDGVLRHAVFAVYGKQTAEQMVEIDASEGGTRIWGLIGIGELAKATRAHQAFFINGRAVRCAALSRALEEVCKSRVTIGMYPMCALNLEIPPTSVNVNVHPNKLEVRFKDESSMRMVAEHLLSQAFDGEHVLQLGDERRAVKPIERVTTVREITPPAAERTSAAQESACGERQAQNDAPALPDSAPAKNPEAPAAAPGMPAASRSDRQDPGVQLDLFHRQLNSAIQSLGGSSGTTALREDFALQGLPAPCTQAQKPSGAGEGSRAAASEPIIAEKPASDAPRAEYRVIGVLLKTYILLEADDSLLLIDQHAAHERLQYEKYMAQLEAGMGSQRLLTPMILRVTAREMALIQDNLEVLGSVGYDVEPFGEQDIQIRAVPHILGKADMKPAFMSAIDALNTLKNATIETRRAEIMQISCKSAVKGGDPLTDSEIHALIRTMLETGAPPTCPHGRPVMKSISRRELEKMFKRIQ